jgi:hypothetical protein
MAKPKLNEPTVKWVSYFDLPEFEPVMKQGPNVCKAKHVSLEDLLKLFHPEVHEGLMALALRGGVEYLVCFENLDMSSSQFGHRSAVSAGTPDEKHPKRWSLEFILQTPSIRLGNVSDRHQPPVAYASTGALKRAKKQLELSLEVCRA